MKIFNKVMWRPIRDCGDVTPEAQLIYEEQLKDRARTGRVVTVTVCVLNLFVSGIIAMFNIGWLLFGIAAAGIFFSLRGRELGRIMQVVVSFFLALISYSITLIILMADLPEYRDMDMLFKFIGVYGIVTTVFLLRSKHIGSWFEYAGSYKCRYLGKRFFE